MISIAIDLGNTNQKVALYNGDLNVATGIFARLSPAILQNFIDQHSPNSGPPTSAILATVVDIQGELLQYLKTNYHFIQLKAGLPLPIEIEYKTPQTLGSDRIAAAVAASNRAGACASLSITAGSCIIYDFVDQHKVYHGGAISPGLEMRMKALNTFSKKLPLVTAQPFDDLIGRTTNESILSGVLNGIAHEIDGFIDNFRQKYPEIIVFMSGGDLNYFDKRLKNNIFAVPNLVLEGLNKIILFNENHQQV
jgi:type III pantothenate kinase